MNEAQWKATKREIDQLKRKAEQSKGAIKQIEARLRELGHDPTNIKQLVASLEKKLTLAKAKAKSAITKFEKEWQHVLTQLETED